MLLISLSNFSRLLQWILRFCQIFLAFWEPISNAFLSSIHAIATFFSTVLYSLWRCAYIVNYRFFLFPCGILYFLRETVHGLLVIIMSPRYACVFRFFIGRHVIDQYLLQMFLFWGSFWIRAGFPFIIYSGIFASSKHLFSLSRIDVNFGPESVNAIMTS